MLDPQFTSQATVSGFATANGAGVADLILNGPGSGLIRVDSVAVEVTGSTSRPRADMYEGPTASGRILATLRAGDAGTFRGQNDILQAGQQYTIRWTNCTPGAQCYAVLRGTLLRQA